jgi:activator of 2-hydroxyglutaryl-CoA dehydratase/predicted nucleotide-binding protein (sugar kinase/HSP70/actin superfamily)
VPDRPLISKNALYIDAGVSSIHACLYDTDGALARELTFSANGDLQQALRSHGVDEMSRGASIYITGKLRDVIHRALGAGERILPSAALWAAAQDLAEHTGNGRTLAIVELSASGYMLIGINPDGSLRDDTLLVNPRCGAGSGVNLDRVLQKLNVDRDAVDVLLAGYLGEENAARRDAVNVRADRCGVFASSATISDKNQGIPLDFALAVTLKSEVLKACKKLPAGFDSVWLTGRIFSWQYARDCATDHFRSLGISQVDFDHAQILPVAGMRRLVGSIGDGCFSQAEEQVRRSEKLSEYPGFADLHEDLRAQHRYLRLPVAAASTADGSGPLLLGLDVGSTMAKLIVSDASGENVVFRGAYSNAGDTISTIKTIFQDLGERFGPELEVLQIGITGSARYQVQQSLGRIYPQLADRIAVLVENYAHARGSVGYAREHLARLKAAGITGINEELCVLVDIGGEDTKVSTIALNKAELFDNAMNVKCSAGTGSLMDTLSALFGLPDIAVACTEGYSAPRGYAINATCAVFLMENARKLQAEGYPRNEIIASANWAIVENMAHSLWKQVQLPANTIVLLHGQTMLSEPLPLAVTERLQHFVGGPVYALVPPDPGHRACFGLIRTLAEQQVSGGVTIRLQDFIERRYEKRIIQCKGAACGDKDARCNRSHLTSHGEDARKFSFSLGGCTAINELLSKKSQKRGSAEDSYKAIWDFIDRHHPRSDAPDRLVIPRSFTVSEWAYLFAHLFEGLGVPVHVDNVCERDVIDAQPHFHIDTCAPHIGVVGQYRRLAASPHGMILAPQLKFLPVKGGSLGRTCTINQGGVAVAKSLAESAFPDARFHLFFVDLREQDPGLLAAQLYPRLKPVFDHYALDVSEAGLRIHLRDALRAQGELRRAAADFAAGIAEVALAEGRQVALVIGREYILNPGVYDSHVGRLLRDQGMAAIPGYLLDAQLAPEFDHLYWRNPHLIATLADAAARRALHTIVGHPRLRELFRRIECDSDILLPVVQVSTFLCGPDSVTTPLVAELTRSRPYLLIQSDAAIKELAHLENRMNTYVRQLDSGLHQELLAGHGETFDIKVLNELVNGEGIDPTRDVIYFPTMGDNRPITAVMRAAGYTCIDNYDDASYDLQALIGAGREFAGDSVCAPLAAVYGDVLCAVEDFKRRRATADPLVAGKQRILIFNNKGLGPCRQGQYVETHKIFIDQMQRQGGAGDEAMLRFLVGHENKAFDFGLPRWTLLRGIQGVVLQGVLHQLQFDLGSSCRDFAEYQRFLAEFRELKAELYSILENRLKPSARGQAVANRLGRIPLVGMAVNYFAYRFHARDLQPPLRRFAARWRRSAPQDTTISVYLEGEVYMRVSQAEELFRTLLATLGFNKFSLVHSPAWSFLDYKLAGMMMRAAEAIAEAKRQLDSPEPVQPRPVLRRRLWQKRKRLAALTAVQWSLRHLLAAPLYRAAGIKLPASMPGVLKVAEEVIPTRRPGGELVPYVGEVLLKLREGYDLVLNVAPEGCMVSSLGEVMTPGIARAAPEAKGRIQHLFSQQGDVDAELLALALLKTVGPERYYRASGQAAR